MSLNSKLGSWSIAYSKIDYILFCRLDTYYKFIFVRDPFTKLLSAWKDKFLREDISGTRRRFGPKIINKYRLFQSCSLLYCRPQRSWGKVMFSHVCVILFTGGLLSQHALQVVSQHALQQVSRGVISKHVLQVVSQHASHQVSRGVCCRGGLLGGSPSGGLLPGGCLVETPPRQLLLRAVRILLECILVSIKNVFKNLHYSYFISKGR